MPNQSAFVRKSALLASGGVDTSMHYAMDYDLWLRIGARYRIAYLPGAVGAWRLLEVSKTHSGVLRQRLECISAVERALADPTLPLEYASLKPRVLQRHIYNALLVALATDEDVIAADLMRRAMDLDLELSRWRYFTGEMIARRTITNIWFGFPQPETLQSVPDKALRLLEAQGRVPSAQARQTIAASHMLRAVCPDQPNSPMNVVRHLVRALQSDRRLPVDPLPKVAAQWIYYGNRLPRMMSFVNMVWRLRHRIGLAANQVGLRDQ